MNLIIISLFINYLLRIIGSKAYLILYKYYVNNILLFTFFPSRNLTLPSMTVLLSAMAQDTVYMEQTRRVLRLCGAIRRPPYLLADRDKLGSELRGERAKPSTMTPPLALQAAADLTAQRYWLF